MLESILRTKRRLDVLVSRLREAGYEFDRPDEVLPGPESGTSAAIARIEGVAGRLPNSLKLFWEHIGSVDLSGSHPDWDECEYLDQLVIFPPSVALYELDEFLADREERIAADFPYSVPIAPDIFHKANVSGGPPYELEVPAESDDPPLINAPNSASFLGHIDLALDYAGFPGLAKCSGHNWPIMRLRQDAG